MTDQTNNPVVLEPVGACDIGSGYELVWFRSAAVIREKGTKRIAVLISPFIDALDVNVRTGEVPDVL